MKSNTPQFQLDNALEVLDFLSPRDTLKKADFIFGFGHYDLSVPQACLDLWKEGWAPEIVFTGGIGSGSIGIEDSEAEYFLEYARSYMPEAIPHIIIEKRSSNTFENLIFSNEVIQRKYPGRSLESGIRRVILVATPFRQKRVSETCRFHYPKVEFINQPPDLSWQTQENTCARAGESLWAWLPQELQKLMDYPAMGFFNPVNIPDEILLASERIYR